MTNTVRMLNHAGGGSVTRQVACCDDDPAAAEEAGVAAPITGLLVVNVLVLVPQLDGLRVTSRNVVSAGAGSYNAANKAGKGPPQARLLGREP